MGLIYKATNLVNGKTYIGQTKSTLNRRISTHRWRSKKRVNTHFYNSIKKYGFKNFEFKILEETTNENLDEREKFFIEKYDSLNSGMNMTKGGKVKTITPEIRRKLTLAQTKRFKDKKEREKISKLQSKWFLIENLRTKETFLSFGLANFCRKFGLSYDCMKRISRGKMKIHKREWTNVRRLVK